MIMTEVKQLQIGDEVFWNDPDNGLTSRSVIIQSIEVKGEIVCIYDRDGDNLECFASELE